MKAKLKESESNNCVAVNPWTLEEHTVLHNRLYDFIYSDEEIFYIVVDGKLFEETSTAFDFVD